MSLPPERTRATTSWPRRSTTSSDTPPSPSETRSPSARLLTTSSTAMPIRDSEHVGVVEPGARTSSAPARRTIPRLGNGEQRIFGPGRSGRIPIWGEVLRIRRISSIALAVVPCANETRATSIPAATSASIISGLLEAGPMVANDARSTSLSARAPSTNENVVEKWEREEASTRLNDRWRDSGQFHNLSMPDAASIWTHRTRSFWRKPQDIRSSGSHENLERSLSQALLSSYLPTAHRVGVPGSRRPTSSPASASSSPAHHGVCLGSSRPPYPPRARRGEGSPIAWIDVARCGSMWPG